MQMSLLHCLLICINVQFFCMFAEDSSMELKVGTYIMIGVGAFTMVMGFLGCLGAIYEIRCLLGLVTHTHTPLNVLLKRSH